MKAINDLREIIQHTPEASRNRTAVRGGAKRTVVAAEVSYAEKSARGSGVAECNDGDRTTTLTMPPPYS